MVLSCGVTASETSAMNPPPDVFTKTRPFTSPRSTRCSRPRRRTSMAASGSAGRPRAAAKSLPVPSGMIPTTTWSSAPAAEASPLIASLTVPSPPAANSASHPSAAAAIAARSASPSPVVMTIATSPYLERRRLLSASMYSGPRSRPDDGFTMTRARVRSVSPPAPDRGSGLPAPGRTACRCRVPFPRAASGRVRPLRSARRSASPRPCA